MKKLISFVLPTFNEENNIMSLVGEVKSFLPAGCLYEIIIVDDGSFDGTRDKIRTLCSDLNIRAVFLYHNFGHQMALLAGINVANGDAVITMDADFQHPPKFIPEMISLWEGGFDLVVAQKSEDKTSPVILKICRWFGYNLYKLFGAGTLIPGVSDFRLMDRKVVDFLKNCREYRFIMRGLVTIPAKKPVFIPYQVAIRKSGESGYGFWKRLALFSYGFVSFSLIPLRLASFFGFLLISSSFIYLGYVLILKLFFNKAIVEGWTAIIAVLITLFGFLFFYLGLLGEYIGAVFDEVKRRPRFLVEESINIPPEDVKRL